MIMSTIGERLTHAMQVRGVRQADLVRASGVTVGHIAHLRRGTRGGATRADTITKLARALAISPEWLATGEGQPPEVTETPLRLRHRPEWPAVLARVLEEHPELPEGAAEAVGEIVDGAGIPALDAVFVRDMAIALQSLRARVARRTG